MIKSILLCAVAAVSSVACVTANAAINIFTEHQIVHMTSHGVNKYQDVAFPSGNYPYIGQVGIEYERKNISYSISYLHRSNVDITHGNEYNYNGVAVGITLRHCILACG